MKILCVCLGNICRSPAAHVALQRQMPQALIESAGTGAWHVGEAPYGPMMAVGLARGYLDMPDLKARQFKREDFARFDLILAMDAQNLADIEALRPRVGQAGYETKVQLFAERDVPDPYYTRDFEGVFSLIEAAAQSLSLQLQMRSAF